MTKFSISPTDLNAALNAGPNSATPPRIFDVRKKPAFDAEPQMIPSASWQVHDQVRDWSRDISTNASIVVYCVHGHEVSQNAAQHLRDLGFDARYLDGGFDEWKTAGFALVDAGDRSEARH